MGRLLLLAIGLSFLTVSSAYGQSKQSFRDGKWEGSFKINYFNSGTVDGLQGTFVDIDSSFGWGFTFGYNYSEHLLMNVSVDVGRADYELLLISEDPTEQDFRLRHELDQSTVHFNMQYNVTDKAFTPYFQAGLGWTYVDSNIASGPAYGGCWWDPWWGYVCQGFQETYDDNSFSYNFGVGLRYEFNYNGFFKASYQNTWVDLDNADKYDAGVFALEFGYTF